MKLNLKLIGIVYILFFALDLILFTYTFYQKDKLYQSTVIDFSENKSGFKMLPVLLSD